MSGTEDDGRISGRFAALKPWHYVVVGVAIIGALAGINFLRHLATAQNYHDSTQAVLASGSSGEGWHPPAFPAPAVEKAAASQPSIPPAPPPAQPVQIQPPRIVPGGDLPDLRMFGQQHAPEAGATAGYPQRAVAPGAPGAPGNDALGGMLKPTELTGFTATKIAKPWATIEQGRIIACNTVTAMTSSLPGFVKARVTYDVQSVDGNVTLIPRNSEIFGEITHGLVNGQERLFVLWRQVTTPKPDFVRITLNSPAADELGEAGLPGDVDHHFWRRVGGALLLSVVDAGLQGASLGIAASLSKAQGGNNNGGNGGGGLSYYNFGSQGQSLAGSMLQSTVTIPDTLHRDQGLPCSIFVGSDLDFSGIYSMKVTQ